MERQLAARIKWFERYYNTHRRPHKWSAPPALGVMNVQSQPTVAPNEQPAPWQSQPAHLPNGFQSAPLKPPQVQLIPASPVNNGQPPAFDNVSPQLVHQSLPIGPSALAPVAVPAPNSLSAVSTPAPNGQTAALVAQQQQQQPPQPQVVSPPVVSPQINTAPQQQQQQQPPQMAAAPQYVYSAPMQVMPDVAPPQNSGSGVPMGGMQQNGAYPYPPVAAGAVTYASVVQSSQYPQPPQAQLPAQATQYNGAQLPVSLQMQQLQQQVQQQQQQLQQVQQQQQLQQQVQQQQLQYPAAAQFVQPQVAAQMMPSQAVQQMQSLPPQAQQPPLTNGYYSVPPVNAQGMPMQSVPYNTVPAAQIQQLQYAGQIGGGFVSDAAPAPSAIQTNPPMVTQYPPQAVLSNGLQQQQQPVLSNGLQQQPVLSNGLQQQPVLSNGLQQPPVLSNGFQQQPVLSNGLQQQSVLSNGLPQQPQPQPQLQMQLPPQPPVMSAVPNVQQQAVVVPVGQWPSPQQTSASTATLQQAQQPVQPSVSLSYAAAVQSPPVLSKSVTPVPEPATAASSGSVAARLQHALESAAAANSSPQQTETHVQQAIPEVGQCVARQRASRESAGGVSVGQRESLEGASHGASEVQSSEKEDSAVENESHGETTTVEQHLGRAGSVSQRHVRLGKGHHHTANAVLTITSIELMDPTKPAAESPGTEHMHRTPSFARKLSVLGDPAAAASSVPDFCVVCQLDMNRAKSTLFKFNPTLDVAEEMSANLVEVKLLPAQYSGSFTRAIDQVKAKFAPLATLPREQLSAALAAVSDELRGKSFHLHRVSPKESEASAPKSHASESESTCNEVHAPNTLDLAAIASQTPPSRLGALRLRQQRQQADSGLAPSASEFDSSQSTSISRKRISNATSESSAEHSMSSSMLADGLEPDEVASSEELATTPQPNALSIPFLMHVARDRFQPDRLSIRDIDFEKQLREVFAGAVLPEDMRGAADKQMGGDLRHPATLTDATQLRQELTDASCNNITLAELARRKSSVPANLIFTMDSIEDSECSSVQSPTSPPATQESSGHSNASSMPQTRSQSVGSRPQLAARLNAMEQQENELPSSSQDSVCHTASNGVCAAPTDGPSAYAHQNSQHSLELSTDSSTNTVLRHSERTAKSSASSTAAAATCNNLSPQSTRSSRSSQTEPVCRPCLPFNYSEFEPLGEYSPNQFPFCTCTLFVTPAKRNLPCVKEVRVRCSRIMLCTDIMSRLVFIASRCTELS